MGNRIEPGGKKAICTFKNPDRTYLAAASSYTQSGSIPGSSVAVAGQTGLFSVSSAQGDTSITIVPTRAGTADVGGAAYSIDGGTTKIGWNAAKIQGIQLLEATATAWDLYAVAVIPETQKAVVVFGEYGTGTLNVAIQDVGGEFSASTSISNISSRRAIALEWDVVGRRLVLITLNSSNQISTYYSENYTTWTILNSASDIGQTIPATCRRIRTARIGRNIILLARNTSTGDIYQYASANNGIDWSYITVDDASAFSAHGIARIGDNSAIFAFADSAGTDISYRILSDAFQPFTASSDTLLNSSMTAIVDVSVTSDSDASCWIVAIDADTNNIGYTWNTATPHIEDSWDGPNEFMDVGNGTTCLKSGFIAAFQCGSLYLIGHQISVDGSLDNSLTALRLTRFTDVEFSGTPVHTWLGLDAPDACGWTQSGVPTSEDLSGEAYRLGTSSASCYFYRQFTANLTPAINFAMYMVSGGSTSSDDCTVSLIASNGSSTYQIRIRFATTGFDIRDVGAGTTVGSVSRVMASQTEFLVGFTSAGVPKVYYKEIEDILWTEVTGLGTFTDTGAAASVWEVRIGNQSATATANAYWLFCSCYTSPGIATGTNMGGRRFSGSPYPLALTQNDDDEVAFLKFNGGTILRGQTYTIDPRYLYGIDNIFPALSPSPKVSWRSNDTSEQIIEFDFDNRTSIGRAWALFVAGANFRTAYLQYHDGSNFTTVGTLDLATGFTSLEYTLTGNTMVPGTSSASTRGMADMEFANGGWAELPNSEARYISVNNSAWWADTTTSTALPYVVLSGNMTGVDSSGSMNLVADSGLMIVYPSNHVIRQRWRIRIPSQTCPDDYFKAGVIGIMEVHPFAQHWTWGASFEKKSQTTSFTDKAGVTFKKKTGENIRTWNFAWSSGLQQKTWRSASNVDYVGISGGTRIARNDTVIQDLDGIMDRTEGNSLPVVATMALPDTSGETITDKSLFIYGHITSSNGYSHANGIEGTSEIVRTENVRIEEIP